MEKLDGIRTCGGMNETALPGDTEVNWHNLTKWLY
jgi:hypothetical protein